MQALSFAVSFALKTNSPYWTLNKTLLSIKVTSPKNFSHDSKNNPPPQVFRQRERAQKNNVYSNVSDFLCFELSDGVVVRFVFAITQNLWHSFFFLAENIFIPLSIFFPLRILNLIFSIMSDFVSTLLTSIQLYFTITLCYTLTETLIFFFLPLSSSA